MDAVPDKDRGLARGVTASTRQSAVTIGWEPKATRHGEQSTGRTAVGPQRLQGEWTARTPWTVFERMMSSEAVE